MRTVTGPGVPRGRRRGAPPAARRCRTGGPPLGGAAPVVEVAERFGVSRQAVHRWVAGVSHQRLEASTDSSERAKFSPWQVPAEVEAQVCEMRRAHPRWGPRGLRAEPVQQGVAPVPHGSSIYRILVRFDLVAPQPRRKRRSEYKRWQTARAVCTVLVRALARVRLPGAGASRRINWD